MSGFLSTDIAKHRAQESAETLGNGVNTWHDLKRNIADAKKVLAVAREEEEELECKAAEVWKKAEAVAHEREVVAVAAAREREVQAEEE